jgi:hypothetical protein
MHRMKHVLVGATVVPLAMSTLGKLGPAAAEGYLQNLATVACSTDVVDRYVTSRNYLVCALVHGHGIGFRHHYRILAKSCWNGFW